MGSSKVEAAPALRHAYFDGEDSVAGAFARLEQDVSAIESGRADRQTAMNFIAWMRGPLIHVLDKAMQAHRDAAHESLEDLKYHQLNDLLLLLTVLMLEAAVVFAPLARRVRDQTDAILEQARQLAKLSADMQELAVTDGLTGLRNRRAFDLEVERLSAAMAVPAADQPEPACGAQALSVGIVLLDLDWFKQVNDRHGHDAGDAVLRAVGDRLRHLCSAADFAARLGGDEFIVILADVSSHAYVAAVAEHLRKIVGEPVSYNGRTLRVGASIGYCVVPNDATSIQEAIGLADDALRADKQKAKLHYQTERGTVLRRRSG
jgi:diguanylate cyclase (GGDEF)-like protein